MNRRQDTTSCVARHFWMAKSIFVDTTFMDLGNITFYA